MNHLLIFVVRLILGLFFGIILTRMFRQDASIYQGAGTGLFLVFLSYCMAYYRRWKQQK